MNTSPIPKTITTPLLLQVGILLPIIVLATLVPDAIISYMGPGYHVGKTIFYTLLLLYVVVTPAVVLNFRKRLYNNKSIEADLQRVIKQIDGTRDAIYMVNQDGLINSWNQGATNVYGYSAEEAIGRSSNELLQTDFADTSLEKVREIMRHSNYWSGELTRITKSGKRVNVRSSSTSVRDTDGDISGYVIVSFDITEEKKLNNAVAHLAQMVEQSSDAIISCSLDENIISWNQAAETLLGFSRTEAVGHAAATLGLMPVLYAEKAAFKKTLFGAGIVVEERRYYKKSGEVFTGELTASTLTDTDGRIAAIVFTIKDVSLRKMWEENIELSKKELESKVMERTLDLRRSEQRFRSLVERNNEIIAVVDITGKLTYRSSSGARLTGYSNEDMRTLTIFDNMHHDDLPVVKRTIAVSREQPGSPFEIQFRYQHKKEHWIILEGSVISLLADEAVQGIVFNLRDATIRIEQENKLIISEERHRHALDSMLEGVQIIGHDWTLLYVNDAACTHLHVAKDQSLGRHLQASLYETDNPVVYAAIQRCFRDRTSIRLEQQYLVNGLSTGWFELSIQPVPEGVFILSIDITENKKAKMQAQQSAQQMKAIFDNTSDGFVLLDKAGMILAHNDMAIKNIPGIAGRSLETGQPVGHFFANDQIAFVQEVILKALAGETVEYENNFPGDAINQWIHFSFSPVMVGGEAMGVCVTSRDISHRKEAEFQLKERMAEKRKLLERLRSIINTLPANIALLDKDGCIIEANQAWIAFYPDNQPNKTYQPPSPELAAGVRCVLSGECREFIEEYQLTRNETTHWYRMLVTPFDDGTTPGAVVMHIDISLVKQMAQDRMNERMAEQQKIKQAMMQGQERERNAIGVELHDNVNQVLAGTTLLLSMVKSGQAAVQDIIPACIDQINIAINENRKIAHQFWSPDLTSGRLTDQLESLASTMLDAAGIDALLFLGDFDETILDADQKTHLYRIAQEQCTNIVKYAKATSVTILLEHGSNTVNMIIEDNGVGMDPAAKAKGIGLKNIRGRMSIYNGVAEITTSPGKGFSLEVRMPVQK